MTDVLIFIHRTSIKWILPFCKSSVQLREKSKSNFIACTHEIRKGFRHLAQLMHREGLLPNENLIFYLTQNELKNHLIQPNSNFIAKACRRKRLFTEWRKYRFGEMHFGLIRPEQDEEIVVSGTHAIEVIGTPVCQGIISGRACVLKSFDEVGKIRSGDILVTHGTDIGWSPYFPMLGGVITELGGLISHGNSTQFYNLVLFYLNLINDIEIFYSRSCSCQRIWPSMYRWSIECYK